MPLAESAIMPQPHHLAQYNIGRMLHDLDDPEMADFVARLDEVNALADRSPGFVWRLAGDAGNATALRPYDDDRILINMSVWRSVEDLFAFAYRSDHRALLRGRRRWFERPEAPHLVLWWVPAGHIPSVAEGYAKLEELRAGGPSAAAFTFDQRFPPPEPRAAVARSA